MILLDTNIISEGMRIHPEPSVMHWLDAQPRSTLRVSAITVDEIVFGINILPLGRRRDRLARAFGEIVAMFGNPLPFDAAAARASAGFRSQRRQAGRPMSLPDSQIAGTAKSNGLSLATLNVGDFDLIDLDVVAPR